MKQGKYIWILLAVLLLVSLSACGEKTNETTAPSESTAPLIDYVPNLSGYWYNGYAVNYYDAALDGNLYYHRNKDDALCVTDLTTMTETLICGKANCKHHQNTCNAYTIGNVLYQDGYIYWVGLNSISRCKIDGTEFTDLVEAGQLYAGNTQYSHVVARDHQFTDNAIYYVVDAEQYINLGDFNFANESVCALIRFDFETGKEELLGEFTDKNVNLIAARDEQALIVLSQVFTDEDRNDPNFTQIKNDAPCSLLAWDIACEGFVTILESTTGECSPYGIRDGKILYNRYKDDTYGIYDPEAETFAPVKVSDTWTVYGDKYTVLYDYTAKNTYLAQAKTGEPINSELADLRIGVIAHDEEGFVIEMDKIVYPAGQDWGETVASTTYYVRYADLEDGLQFADCLTLDHWEITE